MPFWSRKDPASMKVAPKPPAPPPAPQPTGLSCSFCGKGQHEVKKLIAGPTVYICDECIALCNEIIEEDTAKDLPKAPDTATVLAEALEREVVGQPVACRAVAAALFRHLKGIHAEAPHGPVRVLLVGPRGCGKTTLGRALCKATSLPSYHADASRLSETGYIGENVENVVGALLSRAVSDYVAQRGIIFLDGLHHLVRQPPPPASRDVAGREAQRDLVRLLDGLEITAVRHGKRHPEAPYEPTPADRMMIVAAATLDVSARDEISLRAALVEAGLVDETISRFDVIVPMRRLGPPDLAPILDRLVGALRPQIEPATVSLADGTALIEQAAASPDGAWALLPPLSRFRERALLEGPRAWTLDRALSAELLAAR